MASLAECERCFEAYVVIFTNISLLNVAAFTFCWKKTIQSQGFS